MKKMFVYKSVSDIEAAIEKGQKRWDNIVDTVEEIGAAIKKAGKAVATFPFKVHVRFIKFRLNMTDSYLENKAKLCEAVLKEMAQKRKEIAAEQVEARRDLKKLRATYNYPSNPNPLSK